MNRRGGRRAVDPADPLLAPVLDVLRHSEQPVSLAQLLDAGVVEPAHRLNELRLAGYPVERVVVDGAGGYRLAPATADRRARALAGAGRGGALLRRYGLT